MLTAVAVRVAAEMWQQFNTEGRGTYHRLLWQTKSTKKLKVLRNSFPARQAEYNAVICGDEINDSSWMYTNYLVLSTTFWLK